MQVIIHGGEDAMHGGKLCLRSGLIGWAEPANLAHVQCTGRSPQTSCICGGKLSLRSTLIVRAELTNIAHVEARISGDFVDGQQCSKNGRCIAESLLDSNTCSYFVHVELCVWERTDVPRG